MNDTFHEQLVSKKSHANPLAVRIIVIAIVVLLLLIGPLYLGFLSVIAAVVLGVFGYFYIFPHLCVEYEYSLLNHDMEIDVIYNKAKRKQLQSFDIKKAEMIAPKGSDKLAYFNPQKVFDYTSGKPGKTVYAIILPVDQTLCSILIEPDDKLLAHIKPWMGMKFSQF